MFCNWRWHRCTILFIGGCGCFRRLPSTLLLRGCRSRWSCCSFFFLLLGSCGRFVIVDGRRRRRRRLLCCCRRGCICGICSIRSRGRCILFSSRCSICSWRRRLILRSWRGCCFFFLRLFAPPPPSAEASADGRASSAPSPPATAASSSAPASALASASAPVPALASASSFCVCSACGLSLASIALKMTSLHAARSASFGA